MDYYEDLLQEQNFMWDDSENSFSSLLDEIEIRTTFQPSFKNNRSNHKNLCQELNSVCKELDDLKTEESRQQSRFNKLVDLLEEQKSQNQIENSKKKLDAFRKLIKLRWIHDTPTQFSGLIFNDRTGYLKYFSYEKTDSSVREKLWKEISRASSYHYENFLH